LLKLVLHSVISEAGAARPLRERDAPTDDREAAQLHIASLRLAQRRRHIARGNCRDRLAEGPHPTLPSQTGQRLGPGARGVRERCANGLLRPTTLKLRSFTSPVFVSRSEVLTSPSVTASSVSLKVRIRSLRSRPARDPA